VYALYSNSDTDRPHGYVYRNGEVSVAGTTVLRLNTWSHLATTYDGTTLRFYLNGSQVATQAVSGAMPASMGNLSLAGNTIWGEYFAGRLDDLRIYNRALSASEVQSAMDTPVASTTTTTRTITYDYDALQRLTSAVETGCHQLCLQLR
jgi:YD repeat-containing protein